MTLDFASVEKSISAYLDLELKEKRISQELYTKAKKNVMVNLKKWYTDDRINTLSPNFRKAIDSAVKEKRWTDMCTLYVDEINFGTAGIRGLAVLRAFDEPNDKDELRLFAKGGLDAKILKGPNSINNIVLLLKSAGLAKYARAKAFNSIVLGFDNRLHGKEFCELNTRLFLAYGLKIYLFDEAVPYPELMFAVAHLKADLGVFISASHNDKRYNGYKVCRFGSQLEVPERNIIYEKYIKPSTTKDILLGDLEDATIEQLIFLGGEKPLPEGHYFDRMNKRTHIDMHTLHVNHSKQFVIDESLLKEEAAKVHIGYAAFHGAGRKSTVRLLNDFGFKNLQVVKSMQDLNGWFPLFKVAQQPDPGDVTTMEVAMREFVKEHGQAAFDNLDAFMGTDPDADRIGIVVKTPVLHAAYQDKSHILLTADEAWTVLVWYRLMQEQKRNNGKIPDVEKKFVGYTHITTDAIGLLAKRFGLGYIKTWVGFTYLSNSVQKTWRKENIDPEKNHDMIFDIFDMEGRDYNVLVCEQSNGFSILGSPPMVQTDLGVGGHVKDKDGTLAALLFAELLAYAKSQGKTVLDLLDEVYLDKEIGLFVNAYDPSPQFGQYEGLEGITKKIRILKRADTFLQEILAGKKVKLGPHQVTSAKVFKTGKYDAVHNWVGFPDEGIRLFLGDDPLNWLTIRPSGTSQCFRFHVQLRKLVTKENILGEKVRLNAEAKKIFSQIRDILDVHD
jgi:phosphoglucomutase